MFLKSLVGKIFDKFLEDIAGQLVGFFSVLFAIFFSIKKLLENTILTNPGAALFLMTLFFLCAFIFGFKLYFISSKKMINRISVDRNGECYCPNCYGVTVIDRHPVNIGHAVFTCKKCDNFYTAILENGKSVTAHEFYAYQKENPQKVLTSDVYNKWTFEYNEKNKLR